MWGPPYILRRCLPPCSPPYTSFAKRRLAWCLGRLGWEERLCCAEGSPASGVAQAGKEEGGAECELLPSPFYALHRLCPLALRSRASRLLSLWLFVLRKNTALSRGWCMPLTRGSAVCGAKRIAQHANPGLLSSPVRLSAFPQNAIKQSSNQAPSTSIF